MPEAFGGSYLGQRVLVTGHTGFKGGWLSLWLNRLGAHVSGYALPPPTEPALFDLARIAAIVDHTENDIRDLAAFRAALHRARPRFLFHLAAQPIVSRSYAEPLETLSTNVMGTAVILEALREVDWPCAAVIITSDKAYDNVEWAWGYRENDALGGKDIYSGSKGAAELAIKSYRHSFFPNGEGAVRLGIARAGNVIGGGDWAQDRIVVDCVRAWQKGERVRLRSPEATRPWQHVLEPLSGYLALGQALVESPALHGEAFNFGPRAEQSRTVIQLLGDLAREMGLPEDSAYEIVERKPFREAGLLKLNCDKALLDLRWSPTLGYEQVVGMTGQWYRAVLQDGADAQRLSLTQIAAYEAEARRLRQVWTHGPSR
ncbi:CDP-glucose 4,6-dehydratase [Acidisoma sp. 7E03]